MEGAGRGDEMRIVGGEFRGRPLATPRSQSIRPTTDRTREAVFNVLSHRFPEKLEGVRVLDLFAGTGALGIEALSRGARECVFVERDRRLQQLLQDNLVRLKVEGAHVVGTGALDFLAGPARPFDLVFLDPPFEADLWHEAARRLEQGGWLAQAALIHVEAPVDAFPQLPAAWTPHRQARAGAVAHAVYRRAAVDPLS